MGHLQGCTSPDRLTGFSPPAQDPFQLPPGDGRPQGSITDTLQLLCPVPCGLTATLPSPPKSTMSTHHDLLARVTNVQPCAQVHVRPLK